MDAPVATEPTSEVDDYRPSVVTRIAEGLTSLVLGLAVGGIGTFAHQLSWSGLGFPFPLGLVAALVAVAAMVIGVRIIFESRAYAGIAAAGIVGAVAVLALPGVNDSALFPDSLVSTVWAIGPTIIAIVALAWPQLPSRVRWQPPESAVEAAHGEASDSSRDE